MVLEKIASKLDTLARADEVFTKGKEEIAKMSTSDITNKTIPIHQALAVSYGWDVSEPLKKLDDKMKLMIAAVVKKMESVTDYGWPNIMAHMMSEGSIRADGDKVTRSKSLNEEKKSWFKFTETVDNTMVQKVHVWFIDLINDSDVLADTKIKIDLIAAIVGKTGSSVKTFVQLFRSERKYRRDIIDVGVLRYPDYEKPYFKLYRIKLHAWADCSRTIIYSEDSKGIQGSFTKIKFVPREKVLDSLTAEAKTYGINYVNSLFPKKT